MPLDNPTQPCPIILVAGFLGSGKTTLMNRLLKEGLAGKRVAVVVNDFGKVNVDADMIQAEDGQMLQLANGCVCCTLGPQILVGLKRLCEAVRPEVILIEVSGITQVGQLKQVLAVPDLAKDCNVSHAIVLADAARLAKTAPAIRTVAEQIREADLIVLNRCDVASEEEIAQARAVLNILNHHAPILQTTYAQIDPALLLKMPTLRPGDSDVPKDQAPQAHAEQWKSLRLVLENPISEDQAQTVLEELSSLVERAKGVLRTPDGRSIAADISGGRPALTPISPPRGEHVNEMVLIGRTLDLDAIAKPLTALQIKFELHD